MAIHLLQIGHSEVRLAQPVALFADVTILEFGAAHMTRKYVGVSIPIVLMSALTVCDIHALAQTAQPLSVSPRAKCWLLRNTR
jgi:hypothetical protein